jgi:hypothetical protein
MLEVPQEVSYRANHGVTSFTRSFPGSRPEDIRGPPPESSAIYGFPRPDIPVASGRACQPAHGLDATFLELEEADEAAHMHIGG